MYDIQDLQLFNTCLIPPLDVHLTGYERTPGQPEVARLNMICPAFHDHFVCNGFEFIVLPYPTLSVADDVLKAHNFKTHYGTPCKGWEPFYFGYRKTQLPNTYNNTHNIVMCVYFFRNPNIEIERFFEYYYSQGIDKIFMYYCGKLTDRPNLPQRDYVEYFEWDFIHFIDRVPAEPPKKELFSQTYLYNAFMHKISPLCNWTFFCDLDEYIQVPKYTLKEYLALPTHCTHLFTHHRLANINFQTNVITSEHIVTQPHLGKTIIKGDLVKNSHVMGNHKVIGCQLKTEDLTMYHNKILDRQCDSMRLKYITTLYNTK